MRSLSDRRMISHCRDACACAYIVRCESSRAYNKLDRVEITIKTPLFQRHVILRSTGKSQSSICLHRANVTSLCKNVHQKNTCNVSRTGARYGTRKTFREMWILAISVNDEAERSRLVTRVCVKSRHVLRARTSTKHVSLEHINHAEWKGCNKKN